jgi:hypothetical protein
MFWVRLSRPLPDPEPDVGWVRNDCLSVSMMASTERSIIPLVIRSFLFRAWDELQRTAAWTELYLAGFVRETLCLLTPARDCRCRWTGPLRELAGEQILGQSAQSSPASILSQPLQSAAHVSGNP